MKNSILIFLVMFSLQSNAQNRWFTTYSDNIALKADAVKIVNQFKKVKSTNPAIKPDGWKIVKNTTPYLIDIENKIVNLPFWQEVIPQQKDFFAEVAEGKEQSYSQCRKTFIYGFELVGNANPELVTATVFYKGKAIVPKTETICGKPMKIRQQFSFIKNSLKTLDGAKIPYQLPAKRFLLVNDR